MTKEAYWGLLCRSKFVRSSATPMTCGAPGSSRSLANLRCARCIRAQGETNARPPARQGASKVRPGHRQTMGPLWGLNSLSFPLIHFKTSKLSRAAREQNGGPQSDFFPPPGGSGERMLGIALLHLKARRVFASIQHELDGSRSVRIAGLRHVTGFRERCRDFAQ